MTAILAVLAILIVPVFAWAWWAIDRLEWPKA